MDFAEATEQALLRETVRAIADGFGDDYFREKTRTGEKTTELWDALASEGYLGVNLPEEYGGGGLGITELTIVCDAGSCAVTRRGSEKRRGVHPLTGGATARAWPRMPACSVPMSRGKCPVCSACASNVRMAFARLQRGVSARSQNPCK